MGGVLPGGFLVLLVVVGLDDVAYHGTGSLPTVLSAFLHQHGHYDLRIASRRIADKPRIVFEFFLLADARAGIVTNHLCGAGLATELDPGEPQLTAGTPGFVDDAIHGVGNLLDGVLGDGEAFFLHIGSILEHVRLHEEAARGNAPDHARQLQRSGGDGALTGSHGNHFALIPLAVQDTRNPLRRWHQAGFLGRKIDAGLVPDAEVAGIVGQSFDSQAQADIVEKDVAGFQDGLMKVGGAMGLWSGLGVKNPAVILPAEEFGVARTKRRKAFRGNVVFQHRRGRHNLENGTWRQLGLNGAIQQGLLGIFV